MVSLMVVPMRCPIGLFTVALAARLLAVSGDYDGCTSIGVTAGATTDGSTMVTHTSDCVQCDSRVAYIPPRDWPSGALLPIYTARLEYPREVTNRSETYLPVDGQSWSEPVGYIPQVPHTYGYWEAVYGYMNEHGLSLGESTTAANFPVARTNLTALLWIRPLTQLAMERCRTARCAVDTMGGLAEEHGFYGEDEGPTGAGEVLVLVDGKEVWVFEITGDGTGKGAFWAAKRVPDGHVVVVANNFVIREVDCDDTEHFRCSKELPSKAKAAGAWNGKGKLDWARAMGPDIRSFSYNPGYAPIPMYTTARLWRIFSRVAPSAGVKLTDDTYAFPFSVRSESPISHRHLMDLKRDHYEGTEIDLTVGPLAGPFGSPNRVEGGEGLKVTQGQFARAISLPRTSYCALGHTFGSKSGEGSLNKWWFASDAPASSVFVPFYANTTEYARSYGIGHMSKYDDRSAWWVFDFVANWMEINYRLMRVDVEQQLHELQDYIDQLREPVEAVCLELMQRGSSDEAFENLEQFQISVQQLIVDTWREFGHHLIMKYNDGHLNYPAIAQPIGYPAWWLQTFGVNDQILTKWARPSISPPTLYARCGPGPFGNCSDADVAMDASRTGTNDAEAPEPTTSWRLATVAWIASYAATFACGWALGTGRLASRSRNGRLISSDGGDPSISCHYVAA